MMHSIELVNITKSFGNNIILKDLNINFDNEKINCIIGESGSGKSTLLNIISGLVKSDSGKIDGIKSNEVSYIFQEDRLIPWLTVKENLVIALKNYFNNKKELDENIDKILQLVGGVSWKDMYPDKLSGGMRQRVNIARALLKPSKVLLMDEPFKSLDYKTKYLIMRDLKEILKNEKRIVIFVTHDLDECIFFEGKIIVVGGHPLEIRGIYEEDLQKRVDDIINIL